MVGGLGESDGVSVLSETSLRLMKINGRASLKASMDRLYQRYSRERFFWRQPHGLDDNRSLNRDGL